MSCAACSTKTLRSFLRSFIYLESHDPAKPILPYKVRQATRRPFNTSSSNKYRSSLPASSQLQLSELSTKLDDTYLPFVKLPADAEDDKHTPHWLSTPITNPRRRPQQVSVESLVVTDQPFGSPIDTSQSPRLSAEPGVGNDIATTRNSTFTYREEKGVRSRTEFLRRGKANIAHQIPHKGARRRDVATASARRSRGPLEVVGAGQTSLKASPMNRVRETTEKPSRVRGQTATSITGSVRAELGKRHGPREREVWQIQKSALAAKFGPQGWAPRKRLSPDALDGIRALHAQYPEKYTTPVLADQFKVSPEAIRRILKSKWRPSEEEEVDRRQRWDKRGEIIWSQMVEIGIKPPKKWREMGVGTHQGDRSKTKKQQGTQSTTHLKRSKLRDTDPGGPEHDAFIKGSLADRIL